MTALVVAHGGTGGAIVEATFLLLPVVAFFGLSRWSKQRDRAAAERPAAHDSPGTDQRS